MIALRIGPKRCSTAYVFVFYPEVLSSSEGDQELGASTACHFSGTKINRMVCQLKASHTREYPQGRPDVKPINDETRKANMIVIRSRQKFVALFPLIVGSVTAYNTYLPSEQRVGPGGFVGVAQDQQTLTLRPEIGWAVREAPTNG